MWKDKSSLTVHYDTQRFNKQIHKWYFDFAEEPEFWFTDCVQNHQDFAVTATVDGAIADDGRLWLQVLEPHCDFFTG